MKKTLSITFMLVFVISLMAMAMAVDDDHKGNQTKCPVMGGDINEEVFTDHNGERVFFCCAGCDKKFKADPEKYLEKMKADGVKLMKVSAQSSCPTCGHKLASKEHFVDVDGKRVYVCGEKCGAKVKADPAAAMKKIHEKCESVEEVKK